jgi:APA family basic amino acid/polyamine antiporter
VAFGLVCFSVIWLRAKRPDLPRHFKVPCYPVVPAIGVILCFVLAYIGVEQAIRMWFFWFILGTVVLYFIFPYWLSPMRNRGEKAAS